MGNVNSIFHSIELQFVKVMHALSYMSVLYHVGEATKNAIFSGFDSNTICYP